MKLYFIIITNSVLCITIYVYYMMVITFVFPTIASRIVLFDCDLLKHFLFCFTDHRARRLQTRRPIPLLALAGTARARR